MCLDIMSLAASAPAYSRIACERSKCAIPSADDAKIGELRALSSQLLTSVREARPPSFWASRSYAGREL